MGQIKKRSACTKNIMTMLQFGNPATRCLPSQK